MGNAQPTTLDYDVLIEAATEAGLDERAIRTDYSGRGMYGRTCLGLVHRSLNELLCFHEALRDRGVETGWLHDSCREDAMGLNRITYWPGVTVARVEPITQTEGSHHG